MHKIKEIEIPDDKQSLKSLVLNILHQILKGFFILMQQ